MSCRLHTFNPVSTTHKRTPVMGDNGRVTYVTEVVTYDFRDNKKDITVHDFSIENLTALGAIGQLKNVSLNGLNVDKVSSIAENVMTPQIPANNVP